jgi:hypothetical protein
LKIAKTVFFGDVKREISGFFWIWQVIFGERGDSAGGSFCATDVVLHLYKNNKTRSLTYWFTRKYKSGLAVFGK